MEMEMEEISVDRDAHCSERSLIISSEGRSLRGQTRNYPTRVTQNTGSTTTIEDIKGLYEKIGNALASPNALSGSISLANEFSEKANNVSHFYKNKWVFAGYTFCAFCTVVFGVILLTVEFEDEAVSAYLLIPMLGPLILSVLIALAWRCVMTFSGSLLLRSRLESLEEYLELCEINSDQFEQIIEETDHGVCDYKIVGSAGDGFGFFPSQGSNKHIFQKKSVLTQDIDMNIFINSFVPQERHFDRDQVAKGFTWIRFSEKEYAEVKDPVLENSLVKDPGNGYRLKAKAISSEVRGFFKRNGDDANTEIIEHYPALTLKTSGHGPNGLQEYEVDYAFALRYPEWPKEAKEWKTRKRFGLDQKTVDHIVSRGCYLVHKSCGNNKADEKEHDFDWRFTFASAEADLFHYHRDKRALRLAFVILKFMIKISTKTQGIFDAFFFSSVPCVAVMEALDGADKENRVLRTYHLKTVFLWMAEQETTLDYYTIKGNKTLGKVFLAMLNQYILYIESGYLPNYFMEGRNMLEGIAYTENHFRKALKLLKDLRKNSTWKIILLFERQFVNKKALATITISLMLILLIVMSISWYFQFSSLADTTTSTDSSDDTEVIPTYNYKIFSVKYQQFLYELYNNITNSTASV